MIFENLRIYSVNSIFTHLTFNGGQAVSKPFMYFGERTFEEQVNIMPPYGVETKTGDFVVSTTKLRDVV